MLGPFSRRLYLRIWLATVGGVLVFALVVGWAWRIAAEHNARTLNAPPPREMQITDAQGQPILQGLASREPGRWENGVTYQIETPDGRVYMLQMAPRPRPAGGAGPRNHRDGPFWLAPPYGFLWILALVGLAVTLGVFPIIRKLLQRLERLQRSVQRFGEGDLSVRVPEQGHDEVARLARQFNAAAARIQTLVQSHKSLLANASHELRSPLARIRMGIGLMEGDAPSPETLAELQRNIAELDQLIDEILLASRLDAGAQNIGTVEMVDLVGLAAEECARVGAELDVAEGTVIPELPGIVRLLRRAVRNLLENARRYSAGAVELTLTRSPDAVQLHVSDHGPGVPPGQRERIFEPFYRLPGASERSGGVGLGLALVRSIAERHGGSIRCEDRADGQRGASFVLRLPLGGMR